MREIPQLKKKPGFALVLSGGATKAFYFHLGVLRVLGTDNVSSIVGSSAGAIMGAFIASGATVDTLLTSLYQKQVYLPKFDAWIKTLTSQMLFKPRYMSIARQSAYTGLNALQFLATLPRLYNKDILAEVIDTLVDSQSQSAGFFNSVALEHLFESLLPSNDFADAEIDLYVTGTCLDYDVRGVFNGLYDFQDGDNFFMTDVPISKAVRASSSLPGMFEPVKIKGRYYVDGEIRQTLSADVGLNVADKVIVSHTYQPLFMAGEGSVRDLGWVNVLKQSLFIALRERIDIWRKLYMQLYPDKEILWIEPDPDDSDFFLSPEFSFRPEVQRKLIASGERAAERALSNSQSKTVYLDRRLR
ncbi:MAG: hypothetical protein GYB67_15010 [Chloroflexi bacterium]|nr:hypothetical protein [Chloroflexota bacterium]